MQYRYHCTDCGKTLITSETVSETERTCLCGKVLTGQPYTRKIPQLSQELQAVYKIDEANRLRGKLCADWGITNKSHRRHGSNFSSPQTLKALIDNIVAPVTGNDRERVRRLVIESYGYDIDTQSMA